jgi:phenylacetate-CoA ligase
MLTQPPLSNVQNLLFPAFPGLQATQQMALQFQLGESQWWPRELLETHQFRQLRQLLAHACQTVPFYRDLFAARDISLPATIDRAFLETLPVVRRSDFQSGSESFLSTAPPKEHGPVSFGMTSGSTGRPIRFGRSVATQTLWGAFALRDLLWHPRDPSGKLCAIRWSHRGVAKAPDGTSHPSWGGITDQLFKSGPSAVLNVDSTLEEQLTWLLREKPDFLISCPSNLQALAAHAARHGMALPRLRELRTIGETVTPEVRRQLSEAWQAKIIDCYSCEESGYIALQCPDHDHYHIQAENVYVEILDENDRPCPVGVVGRIVLTNLNNFVTPLIRYEIGDYGEFAEACPCGRGLPVLKRIHGRSRNRLMLPNGGNLFPNFGGQGQITALTGVPLYQFQFLQHSLQQLEAKLVMARPLDSEEQAKVAEFLLRNLGHSFEVVFSFPAEIPRGPNGKFEEFKCLIGSGS